MYILRLLLILIVFIDAASLYRGSRRNLSGRGRSIDDYWQQSDFPTEESAKIFTLENCTKDRRVFLACINGISIMAERVGLSLNQNAELIDSSESAGGTGSKSGIGVTEKLALEDWKKKWFEDNHASVQFEQLFLRLKGKLVGLSSETSVLAAGMNAYYSVSEDPHTYVVPLAFYEDVLAQSDVSQFPLGFVARRTQSGIVVRKVFEKSPAGKAGLKRGDSILSINLKAVAKLTPWQYYSLVRGSQEQRMLIEIERKNRSGESYKKKVELLRGPVEFINVESRVIEKQHKKLGLIGVQKFGNETCLAVRNAIQTLMEQSVSGIILDLRDNPGGQVNEAACIINLFVDKGSVLFETRYLDPEISSEFYSAQGEKVYSGPLAILINAGSASASEIVAGSLKDSGRATLVGERSFGKGSFQDGTIFEGTKRVALFQTRGFYYFPTGWTPQLVGIEPDVNAGPSDESVLREKDLYLEPLRPRDLWSGPQSLAWLKTGFCEQDPADITEPDSDADLQVEAAQKIFNCRTAFQ